MIVVLLESRMRQPRARLSPMDGVAVKVGERCKPPPPIDAPSGLLEAQRALPKRLEALHYDFSLERCVLARLDEWRAARDSARDARDHRLRLREEAKQRELDRRAADEAEATLRHLDVSEVRYPSADELADGDGDDAPPVRPRSPPSHPAPLRPTLVANGAPTRVDLFDDLDAIRRLQRNANASRLSKLGRNRVEALSVSDFENDTSSPFDNVELKTINDMELLAQVLAPQATLSPPPMTVAPVSSTTVAPVTISTIASVIAARPRSPTPVRPSTDSRSRSVPDIVRELDREVMSARRDGSPVPRRVEREPLPNPFETLPPRSQSVCKSINVMGFPLDRVARACSDVGDDDKKIIEYLLCMSQLMDLGFPESKVAKALLQHDCNRDQALDELIS